MDFSRLLFWLEMIGNTAFAVSGVMVARDRHMDLFGASLLGCCTACGGGVIRDILLGQLPPAMFTNPVYVAAAFVVSVVVFFFFYLKEKEAFHHSSRSSNGTHSRNDEVRKSDPRNRTSQKNLSSSCEQQESLFPTGNHVAKSRQRSDAILNAADSIGLAAFVVVGYQVCADCGYADNGFLCIFVGVVTGIGGGILRDILAGQMPLIMRKRIYGVAAIAGGFVYWLCLHLFPGVILSSLVSIFATILLRFLAIHYRWNLPKL